MQNPMINQNGKRLYFNSPFSAIQAVASVLDQPLKISANQDVMAAQALRQSGIAFSFLDVDYYGLAMPEGDCSMMVTDYAGVLPDISAKIILWSNGAGYLEKEPDGEVVIIDLKTVDPNAKTSGAVVIGEDEKLLEALKTFALLGVTKGAVWNDKVEQPGIDGLMDELAYEYWQQNMESLLEQTTKRDEIVAFYRERFAPLKLIDLMPTSHPRFFPVRLAPELLCPKEDIYTQLQAQGVAVSVPFKPLYRYDLFKSESFRSTEQFYKAALALPLDTTELSEAERIANGFIEVIESYAYRGCSF